MPSVELVATFLLTTALFAYIPGPAMLYAAAQTMAHGRLPGLLATLGIHLGGYGHVIAAASGLALLFIAVPPLYLAVKLVGAAYLVWLGNSMIRAKAAGQVDLPKPSPKAHRRILLESILVEVLNPKTALFFVAFLPQFVDPAATFPVWLQLLVMGTIVNLMFSSADVVCVILAGAVTERLRQSGRLQRLVRRAGGTLLVGLGAHLALQAK